MALFYPHFSGKHPIYSPVEKLYKLVPQLEQNTNVGKTHRFISVSTIFVQIPFLNGTGNLWTKWRF